MWQINVHCTHSTEMKIKYMMSNRLLNRQNSLTNIVTNLTHTLPIDNAVKLTQDTLAKYMISLHSQGRLFQHNRCHDRYGSPPAAEYATNRAKNLLKSMNKGNNIKSFKIA